MSFRGVYRDGVVVPDERVNLPEGTSVEFSRSDTQGTNGTHPLVRKRVLKKPGKKPAPAKLFGLGIWREDPTLGHTSEEVARSLRAGVMRRGRNG